MSILKDSITKLRVNNEVHQVTINIQKETKQKDVISLLLFIVFLCPLLWTLKDTQPKKCKDFKWRKVEFNNAVIVNDIAFRTSMAEDVKLGFQTIKDFFKATGIQINAKKSAYTYKNIDRSIFPSNKSMLFSILGVDKSYRYLSLWINLDLNWTIILDKMKDSIWKRLEMITKKKYLTVNTICKLINSTIYMKIEYKMQVLMLLQK